MTRRSMGAINDSKDMIKWTVGVNAHPEIRIVRSKDVSRRSVEVIVPSKDTLDDSKDVIDWFVEVIVHADRVTRQAE